MAHGAGELSRLPGILMMALIMLLNIPITVWYIDYTIYTIGLLIGLAPGWGKYFPTDKLNRDEKEIGFIDKIINYIETDSTAAFVGMALRWGVFFAPLLLFLDKLILAAPLGIIVSICYSVCINGFGQKSWRVMEFLSGLILGIVLLS
jgi:hypothetical protein